MLVEGIVEMVKVVTLDTDTLNHLKSKPVWTAASEYVSGLTVSEPISSLTLPRLIEVLSLYQTQPDLPHNAKEKYDAFVQALLVRLNSAFSNRLLTYHDRQWASSLYQNLMWNS
jgi:hypothetical protein